jgi:subtilisin family serine protease
MKKFLFSSLAVLFCLLIFGQDLIAQGGSYYWADDSRMALTASNTHFIVTADDASTLTSVKPQNVVKYESWAHKPYAVVEMANSVTIHELIVELGFDTDEVQVSPGYAISDGFIIYPTRTIVAKLIDKDDTAEMLRLAKRFGMKDIKRKYGTFRMEMENVDQVLDAANALHESGLFYFAQPDFYAPIERFQINDPLFSQQFQMNNTGQTIDGVTGANDADCNALEAWGISLGSASTTVAVIDDGMEDHEDFNNASGQSRYTNGFSPANNGNGDAISGSDHGVACAGSISATHNNIGVRGVAPLANMISVNIFIGGESTQDLADGFTWAKNAGADVMSNSWGYTSCTLNFSNINSAMADANTNGRGGLGCVIIFASGNGYKSCVDYPANNPDVIAVGAFANTGIRSAYSNYGPALDIMAPSNNVGGPGAGVRTTDRMGGPGYNGTNYTSTFGGTSSACPVVAGVATLLLGYDASLTSDQVKNILYSTAIDMGAPGVDNEYANGRVNALGALIAAGGGDPSCTDGVQNGDETGVDCGGPDCPACPTCSDGVQNGNETDIDCGGPDCPACPCDNNLTLTIVLDNYPEETSWDVRDASNNVIASGAYSTANPDGSTVVENICVSDGCFDFTIYDSYGDGICCIYGNGSYTLTNDADGSTLASGGSFGSSETTNFCVTSGGGQTCDAPTGLTSTPSDTEALLSWTAVSGATDYNVRARQVGTSTWTVGNNLGIPVNFTGLTACTDYEFQIQTNCSNGATSDWSSMSTFTTTGCTGCSYVTVDDNNFESGWGIWNDGGSDCRRSANDATYALGTYCVRLRDNTSTSTMTTDNIDLSNYSELTVDFSYYPRSMDNSNEDFWLQISTDGGSTYTTVEEWNTNDEFVNNQRYYDSVIIPGPFTSNTRLRFRCDASGNSDWVYIDEVIISGCTSSPSNNNIGPDTDSVDQPNMVENNVIEAKQPITAVNLFPNPTNGALTVRFTTAKALTVQMAISDLSGKIIQTRQFNTDLGLQEINVDASRLNAGIYFMHIISAEGKVTEKFIVIE